MRPGFVVAAMLVGMAAPSFAAQAPLTLVRDGKAASVIVTADKPSSSARDAASDLQMWLEKAGGATIPIQTESRLPAESKETRILVGDSNAARALGVDPSKFGLEEIRIQTFPGALVIIGGDERPDGVALKGTLWRSGPSPSSNWACAFCGRANWAWSCRRRRPSRSARSIRASCPFCANAPSATATTMRGFRPGWINWAGTPSSSSATTRNPRCGSAFIASAAVSSAVTAMPTENTGTGSRRSTPSGSPCNRTARATKAAHRTASARRCASRSRALIEQVARDAIEALRKDPTADCVSLSPNDGAAVTHCLCKNCEAWDAPDGEMIEMWGPKEPTRHVSLSDRYVRFYSEVAAIVAREFPHRNLGAYAYGGYRLPPHREKLHPNVVLGFVGFSYLNESYRQQSREAWQQWSEKAGRIFLRPNALASAMGSPAVHIHRLADDFRFCLDRKMTACDFDCCYHHWASDGLNYYVLAKLLWDPKTDVDAAIADYCRAGFGPAAGTIGEYFRRCEANMEAFARLGTEKKGKDEVAPFAEWTRDEFFVKCHALLDQAAREAGGDETIRQRVAFLRKAVELGEIRHRYWVARTAAKNGDREAANRAKLIEEERMKWYQSLGISWAINVPNLEFYRGRF